MSADPPRVAALILAAGTSSRMGTNKLFLELGGETVLRRAVRMAREAHLSPILVVLGHESERARAQLEGLRCTAVLNRDYARGMNTSVSAGASALGDDAEAAVVLLPDMPLVTAAMIREMVSRWQGEPLVISLFGEVIAPPILYARALFPELRALAGESCGKRVIRDHRAEAAEVHWPASALQDLDVPADLERVRSAMEGS